MILQATRVAYVLSSSCLFVALMGKLILSFKNVLRTTGRSKAHYCKTVLLLARYSRDADEMQTRKSGSDGQVITASGLPF